MPSAERYRYRAYGLGVESDFPLPSLEPANGPADITIRAITDQPWRGDLSGAVNWQSLTREEGVFWVRDVAAFHLRAGKEIQVYVVNNE